MDGSRRLPVAILLSLIWLALSSTRVHAFDCTGHLLVAMVALQQVSPSVLDQVQPLYQELAMRYADLSTEAEVACLPLDMYAYTTQYREWFYYDGCVPRPENYTCPPPPTNGSLPQALQAARTGLADTSLSTSERAAWFAFLLYLVGDAHQPTQMCSLYSKDFPDGDAQGTQFFVSVEGTLTPIQSLISVSSLLSHPLARPIALYTGQYKELEIATAGLITTAESTLSPMQTFDLDFDKWENATKTLCRNIVYSFVNGTAIDNGTAVDEAYLTRLQTTVQLQIALAGSRLAEMLTDALPTPPEPGLPLVTRLGIGVGGCVVGLIVVALVLHHVDAARRRKKSGLLLEDKGRWYL